MKIDKHKPLVLPLLSLALCLQLPPAEAATIVNVDGTALGLIDGDIISTITNPGSAGDFTTVTGTVVAVSHPSNNNPETVVQGLGFGGETKMNSANPTNSLATPMIGNQPHSAQAWVFNARILAEEAIIAWGRRGDGGRNVGFHQGNNVDYGAVGHWGSSDLTYNNPDDTLILGTANRWAHLAYTFDGNESRVFIDGVLVNSKAHGPLDTHEFLLDGTTPLTFALGAEHSNTDNGLTETPVSFSGTIARVQVDDTALSDAEILAQFNDGKLYFFEGVTDTTDSDNDGIPDVIEDLYSCLDKTVADAEIDFDLDGINNGAEVLTHNTDPCDDDSDDDNIKDGAEVDRMVAGKSAPTDPNKPDTDGDGLNDDVETNTGINNGPTDSGTNPLVADGDSDELTDGQEVLEAMTDPFDDDSDHDGWEDGFEVARKTDPNDNTSFPDGDPSFMVNIDATALEVLDGTPIPSIANTGLVGDFTTNAGEVVTTSHPANNNAEVNIQGLAFDNSKMISEFSARSAGIVGDQSHTVNAWVFNPEIAAEEAILSWGQRGADARNMGFHSGNHPTYGAVGHWGGSNDIGWGPDQDSDGTNIDVTAGKWAHLSKVYDATTTTTTVYINGVPSNSIIHPRPLNPFTEFAPGDEIPIALGAEHDGNSPISTPIPASLTIARVQATYAASTDQEILDIFNAGPSHLNRL